MYDALPVISTSYSVAAPLNNGDSYQWYVSAFDNYGNIGLAAAALTFSIAVPPPAPPVVTGPIGQVKSATTTFQVTSVPGATRYTLYLKDTTSGQLPLGTGAWQIDGGSYTLPFPPVAGDTYQWYVSAYGVSGKLLYQSPTATYVLSTATDLAGPPTPSPLVGPVTAAPTLQWSPVTNSTGYEVEIIDTTAGANGGFPYSAAVDGTSYVPNPPLSPGHTYQWQVEAFDSQGLVTLWSVGQPFHVPLSAPGLVGPSGLTDSTTPMFQWSAAAGAATYQIEITDITAGESAVVVSTSVGGGTSYTPAAPLSVGHTYQWQVETIDSSGALSAWSSPTTFDVLPAAPVATNQPAVGGTSSMPTLQWSAVPGAAGYELEIIDVTGGGSVPVVGPVKVGGLSYGRGCAAGDRPHL